MVEKKIKDIVSKTKTLKNKIKEFKIKKNIPKDNKPNIIQQDRKSLRFIDALDGVYSLEEVEIIKNADLSQSRTLQASFLMEDDDKRKAFISKILPDAVYIKTMEELTSKYILSDQMLISEVSKEKKDILTHNGAILCENIETGKKAIGFVIPFLDIQKLFFEEYFFIGNEIFQFYTKDTRSLQFIGVDNENKVENLLQYMESNNIADLHLKMANEFSYQITGRIGSDIETLSKNQFLNIEIIKELIESLIIAADQDPYVKKPEIRGLLKEKVFNKDGAKITRTYRLHIIEQSYAGKVGFSVSIRRLMNYKELRGMTLPKMGYTGETNKILNNIVKYVNNGLIIVSGAVNSGKSTFLYKMVDMLLESGKRVITVEAPIEIPIPGIIQIDLKNTEDADDELKFTLEKAIASMLSHDLDVGLINEVRYESEIKKLIELALVGHLAATTMHANDVKSTIVRLLEVVNDTQVFGTFRLFVNQRLIDLKCLECNGTGEDNEENPCKKCDGRKTYGKIALPEVLYFKRRLEKDDPIYDFEKLVEMGKADYFPRIHFGQELYDKNLLLDQTWKEIQIEAGVIDEL